MKHYHNKKLPVIYNDQDQEYLPGKGLVAALDVALELNMPLLLTGEPGTGKTRFANHVARYFKLGEAIRFDAKTTSTATDLFYVYDALRHYHIVQNQSKGEEEIDLIAQKIIRFEALGEAAQRATKHNKRSVVLIDEIDKAPRDFPNDLLNVMEGDYLQFSVPELQETFKISPELKPIVIITSNSEKSLPEPFLRRCIFYHIPFPDPESLLEIVKSKLYERRKDTFFQDELVILIKEFNKIRGLLKQRNAKVPATAELISWLIILKKAGLSNADFSDLNQEQQQILASSLSIVAKSTEAYQYLLEHYKITNPTSVK
ncbi:AAA family ATPase [Lewinella sp. LCG006]|uniref:AAA family ATPase n=1 Tax=Lewinella sp. LCG006 TaxID=3231911 RepID=UPI00346035CD